MIIIKNNYTCNTTANKIWLQLKIILNCPSTLHKKSNCKLTVFSTLLTVLVVRPWPAHPSLNVNSGPMFEQNFDTVLISEWQNGEVQSLIMIWWENSPIKIYGFSQIFFHYANNSHYLLTHCGWGREWANWPSGQSISDTLGTS